jgi:hypothetical protein
MGAYAASNFAVRGFSKNLRQELDKTEDIHVCTVMPMSADTPISHHAANYSRRHGRPVPPVVHPRRVVNAIVRCVLSPKPEVTVGMTGHALAVLEGIFPRLVDVLVPRLFRWNTLGSRDTEPNDGNLFEPMPEWNQVSGRWRRTTARRLVIGGGVAAAASLLAWWAIRRRR